MRLPQLLAIDMDGTLLGPDSRVSQRNLQALRAAEQAGIEVVIATGRRHAYAMRVLRDLQLHHAHALVSSNGTVIRTIGSELLHREHMPLSTARWLCEHVADFRNTLVLTFDTVGANGDDVEGALVVEEFDALHASIGNWMAANAPYILHVRPIESALDGNPPIQMMLCGSVARMREAAERLMEHPRVVSDDSGNDVPDAEVTLHRTEYTDRDLCILDILPAGVSKASALQHLVRMRGFGMEDVMAIGDNWNDLPMLELAGQAVLMSNAPESLKTLAHDRGWTVGLSNLEDGVAVAIEAALTAAPEVPVSA